MSKTKRTDSDRESTDIEELGNAEIAEYSDTENISGESDYEEWEQEKIKVFRRKQERTIEPDYESDSSTDETLNAVGNIPMEWYNDYPHIGYDINGQKILRPAKGDELENFLKTMDDNDAWKTLHDKLEGKDFVLSKEELEILKRIQTNSFPETAFDPYEPTIEWFTSDVLKTPLSAAPEPKRRFVPSKWEASKIMKIARAIKAGLIVPGRQKRVKPEAKYYDIWDNSETVERPDHISAPKQSLPENNESYNPPEEYILDKEEEENWKNQDPEDRSHNFLPRKFDALRRVPAYDRFIQERFERCLDLYLCPRTIKQKLNIDPESLIPKLPSPKDLKPFPTKLSIVYKGHKDKIRCFDIDSTGQWLASGSDDETVRIWELSTGRNVKTYNVQGKVMSISWNPNPNLFLLAFATEKRISFLKPNLATSEILEETETVIKTALSKASNEGSAEWKKPSESEMKEGFMLFINMKTIITNFCWHRKGDYFATVSPKAVSSSVMIFQLSKGTAQSPFKKSPGLVQKILFHPNKPHIFVATQKYVRVYNLAKQELLRKLTPGSRWISSISIHPMGNII